jgi:hypothetical protein
MVEYPPEYVGDEVGRPRVKFVVISCISKQGEQ